MEFRRNYGSPIGKLRVLGFVEGISFVLLVFVAMPLKYWMGVPIFVRILGTAHGILFLWLGAEIAQAVFGRGFPVKKGAIVFAATLFPFGPFLIDRWLEKEQRQFDAMIRAAESV